MDILESIYKYLSSDSEVKAIVGDKIYPEIIPQGVSLPAIVYAPTNCYYDSALQKDTGFSRLRIQFTCYDNTFGKARRLGRAVKKVFQDFKGNMFGNEIQAVFIRSDFMSLSNLKLNYDVEKFASILEIEFQYMEE